jgi:hypothetical protein
MAEREVTVEVIAKYVTKVIAGNPTEARERARDLILLGVVTPYETNEIILDVTEVK